MKVWLKVGVIIFYILGYCFLRKRMRRDIVKLFKAYMLFMIFLLSLLPDEYSAGSEPLYPLERATLSAW